MIISIGFFDPPKSCIGCKHAKVSHPASNLYCDHPGLRYSGVPVRRPVGAYDRKTILKIPDWCPGRNAMRSNQLVPPQPSPGFVTK